MQSIKLYNEAAAIWGQVHPDDDIAVEDFFVKDFPELSADVQGEILDFILANDSHLNLEETAQRAIIQDAPRSLKIYRRFQCTDFNRKTHELKTWPSAFDAIWGDRKHYELRKNDRDFNIGDNIILREFDDVSNSYTGRAVECEITYMTCGGEWGLPEDMCVLSFHVINTTTDFTS